MDFLMKRLSVSGRVWDENFIGCNNEHGEKRGLLDHNLLAR
jgi:hypothetical protein